MEAYPHYEYEQKDIEKLLQPFDVDGIGKTDRFVNAGPVLIVIAKAQPCIPDHGDKAADLVPGRQVFVAPVGVEVVFIQNEQVGKGYDRRVK